MKFQKITHINIIIVKNFSLYVIHYKKIKIEKENCLKNTIKYTQITVFFESVLIVIMFRKTLYFVGLPVFANLSNSFSETTKCEYHEIIQQEHKNTKMSGKQFKKSFQHIEPIMLIHSYDYKRHTLKIGVNDEDDYTFKDVTYISELNLLDNDYNKMNIVEIEILDDSKIKVNERDYVADKIIIKKITQIKKYFENMSEKERIKFLRKNGQIIQFIENPSFKEQLIAVRQDEKNFQLIKVPSKKVRMEVIKKNGKNIQYVVDPSEEEQFEAVKQNGIALGYIKNPSKEIQKEAVKQNENASVFIKNPSKIHQQK